MPKQTATQAEELVAIGRTKKDVIEAAALVGARPPAERPFILYAAYERGPDDYAAVRGLLSRRMTTSAIDNLASLATSVVPFMLQHGIRANIYATKCAMGVLRTRDGRLKSTPEAQDLLRRLQVGDIRQPEVRRIVEKLRARRGHPGSFELRKERESLLHRIAEIDAQLAVFDN